MLALAPGTMAWTLAPGTLAAGTLAAATLRTREGRRAIPRARRAIPRGRVRMLPVYRGQA